MSRPEILKQLEAEAKRIEEDTKLTAKSQYNDAQSWRKWHPILAVIAAVSATVAGFTAFQNSHVVVVFCAFLSAAVSTILSTLKPLDRGNMHHQAGVNLQKLCDDTRIFRTIVLLRDEITEAELQVILQELSDRRATLRGEAPQHSYRGFLKANKGVQDGESGYEVDKQN